MAWITGGWLTVSWEHVTPMMASGLIGIFIGDTALFACLNRMGAKTSRVTLLLPRRVLCHLGLLLI